MLIAVLTREFSADSEADKKADLAGPGIGDYAEWEDPTSEITTAYDAKRKSYFHLRGVSKTISPTNSVS